jgi:hypothetical protein
LAKFASQASVLGVAILAKAINILAGVVRAIITTIQNNIGVLKVLAVSPQSLERLTVLGDFKYY